VPGTVFTRNLPKLAAYTYIAALGSPTAPSPSIEEIVVEMRQAYKRRNHRKPPASMQGVITTKRCDFPKVPVSMRVRAPLSVADNACGSIGALDALRQPSIARARQRPVSSSRISSSMNFRARLRNSI
jgi:hypothetical protein